jgi:hypothetical protein
MTVTLPLPTRRQTPQFRGFAAYIFCLKVIRMEREFVNGMGGICATSLLKSDGLHKT